MHKQKIFFFRKNGRSEYTPAVFFAVQQLRITAVLLTVFAFPPIMSQFTSLSHTAKTPARLSIGYCILQNICKCLYILKKKIMQYLRIEMLYYSHTENRNTIHQDCDAVLVDCDAASSV